MTKRKNATKSNLSSTPKFLAMLTTEINEHRQAASEPGWTKWAILGSFGTIAWVLLAQLGEAPINYGLLISLVYFISLIDIGLNTLRLGLMSSTSKQEPRSRFRISNELLQNHQEVMFILLLRFICMVYLTGIIPIESALARGFSYILNSSVALIFVVFLILSISRIPLQTNPFPPNNARFRISISILATTMAGVAIHGYYFSPTFSENVITLAEIKVTALIIALYWLLLLWLKSPAVSPLIATLASIRRELATGEITLSDARIQANIVLKGLSGAEILQEYYGIFLNLIRNVNVKLDQIAKIDKELEGHLKSKLIVEKSTRKGIISVNGWQN